MPDETIAAGDRTDGIDVLWTGCPDSKHSVFAEAWCLHSLNITIMVADNMSIRSAHEDDVIDRIDPPKIAGQTSVDLRPIISIPVYHNGAIATVSPDRVDICR